MTNEYPCTVDGCDRTFPSKRARSFHKTTTHDTDKPWQDAETLKDLYVDKQLTQEEISERLGCGVTTVTEWISHHEIERPTPDWQKEDVLRELFVKEGLDSGEVAEELGCARSIVNKWLRRHGIEHEQPEWRDEEVLREMYVEQRMSTLEIAEQLGCASTTVRENLHKNGIETRPSTKVKPPYFRTTIKGYEEWKCRVDGDHQSVLVHRLLAVSEYGFEAVQGQHVHHKNGFKWDNRPSNIEPVGPGEHIAEHHEEGLYDEHLEELHEQLRSDEDSEEVDASE